MKLRQATARVAGYTLLEMAVSSSIFAVIMGVVVTGTIALQRSIKSAENFTIGQMHLPDLIAMDAHRGYNVTPTQVGTNYTLPLTIVSPSVYKPDGKTMLDPVRSKTSVTVVVKGTGKAVKNPHNFTRVLWPLAYGTTGSTPTETITYSQIGTTIFRTSGGVSRAVATGVQSISFDPPSYDLTTSTGYILTTRITFVKSQTNKSATSTNNVLVSSIFTRGDFYDNDHD